MRLSNLSVKLYSCCSLLVSCHVESAISDAEEGSLFAVYIGVESEAVEWITCACENEGVTLFRVTVKVHDEADVLNGA